MFRNILVPTDGSEFSRHAIEQGIELAKLSGGKITALHVAKPFRGSPYGTFGPSEDVLEQGHARREHDTADHLFEDIVTMARNAGVVADTVLSTGRDVYREIVATAASNHCDLICMASHGRHGLSGVLLGSETQKVLTHVTTPVLVVH